MLIKLSCKPGAIVLVLILALLSPDHVLGQEKTSLNDFTKDFSKALNKNFSEEQLNKMFRNYDKLLTPHSDVTRLTEHFKSNEISVFPLYDFKHEKLYTDNINKLLTSPNPNHRILAYLVIASSDDTSKEEILVKKIKTEKKEGNLLWAGMALLYLQCDKTTPIFDFLVKNEDFGDAHMLPLFIHLNKDSLQQTAYKRISNEDVKAKVLAAQILSVTTLNAKTEELLKQAVKNWDFGIKGFAIYSIKALQIGNLLETLRPLLDSPKTRSISLQALANSPTDADQNYLRHLTAGNDTLSSDILDCFYKSQKPENIKYWLNLLQSKLTPAGYRFFIFTQPLIRSDDVLPEIQKALQTIKNPETLGELVRALEGRTDDKSIEIMIGLLKNTNTSVRYWTAKTLENNNSPKTKAPGVTDLIINGLRDGN